MKLKDFLETMSTRSHLDVVFSNDPYKLFSVRKFDNQCTTHYQKDIDDNKEKEIEYFTATGKNNFLICLK